MTAIACPVALHPDGAPRRIAVFTAGDGSLRLVHSPCPPDLLPQTAAARALFDQSGLESRAALPLGTSDRVQPGVLWHFTLCRIVPPVRDRWAHVQASASELRHFHWLPLDDPLPAAMDATSASALAWLKATV